MKDRNGSERMITGEESTFLLQGIPESTSGGAEKQGHSEDEEGSRLPECCAEKGRLD